MDIRVGSPPTHKGDIYDFTDSFYDWLERELGSRAKESSAFTKKFGSKWTLTFRWDKGTRVKKPRFTAPGIDRKYKEVTWLVEVPRFKFASPKPKSYVPVLRQFLESIIAILTREQIDATRIQKALPVLLKRFASRRGVLEYDPHPYTFGTPEDPYGMEAEAPASTQPIAKSESPQKFAKRKLPKWKIPKNIANLVEEEGGMWESERFDPILLTVMSGQSYSGREIPLAWQIEFEPDAGQFAAANAKIEASGIEPDGDGWAEVVEEKFSSRYPRLAGELHSDSESSTCVLWTESENGCKKLIQLVWSLNYRRK